MGRGLSQARRCRPGGWRWIALPPEPAGCHRLPPRAPWLGSCAPVQRWLLCLPRLEQKPSPLWRTGPACAGGVASRSETGNSSAWHWPPGLWRSTQNAYRFINHPNKKASRGRSLGTGRGINLILSPHNLLLWHEPESPDPDHSRSKLLRPSTLVM